MNMRHSFMVAGAGTVLWFGQANATYIGLELQLHATVSTPSGVRHVYRIYSRFTEGTDTLIVWGSSPTTQATNFHTGPCVSNPFYQAFGGMNTAPAQEFIDQAPHIQWDTFATIGVNVADQGVPTDQTNHSTPFPTFISGSVFNLTNGAIYTPGPMPQGRADFAGDGDGQLRVLMMQLTVTPDNYPYGQIGFLQWSDAGGINHIETFNLTWNILEPIGRCCLPTGTCTIGTHASCAQYVNGYFLYCEPCDACELTCLPDIAPHPGNGVVDIDDLLAVINAWGPCSPWDVCPPDVAPTSIGNNVVDIDDLLVVINGWGTCR